MTGNPKDRIGRRIKLRDLHILLAVAERGSLIKAAHDLAVSAPVISKAISDLEKTVGARLFDRDRHGAAPTNFGRALIDRSIIALDELRQGVQELEVLADPTRGEVTIGAFAAMTAGLLPKVIAELRLTHPRLAFNAIQVLTSPNVYDNLRTRTVDLIIGRLPAQPLDRDLAGEKLFDEPLSIVVGKQSPLARRRKLSITELVNEAWILPQPGTQVSALVDEVFGPHSARPTAPVTCSSVEMYWELLATGRFVAVLPLSLLTFTQQRGALAVLPIKVPARPRPVGIVTLRNRTLSRAASLFIEKTREVIRPLKNHVGRQSAV
jgi:DNA-binding transcriptional LysR family regulator